MDPIVLFQLTFTFIYSTVRFRDTRAHLDLGFQLDNMAYTIPKPNSQATFKPSELKDFHQFIPPIPFRLHSVNCFPRKEVIAWIYNLSAARQCLGGYRCRAYLLEWEPVLRPLSPPSTPT